MDSLDIALESSAKAKFSIVNRDQKYSEVVKAEIGYVVAVKKDKDSASQQPQAVNGEEEEKGEPKRVQGELKSVDDVAEEAEVFDIILNYQAVVNTYVLTEALKIKLETVIGETELAVDFETVNDPRSDIRLQAKLQLAKT